MNLRSVKFMFKVFLTSFFLTFLFGGGKVLADTNSSYTGHNSWDQLTTSNGICAGIYSKKDAKLIRLQHHIFSHEKDGSTTPNYLYDAYFGYQVNNNKTVWLNNLAVDQAEYINGTNIIHSVQHHDQITFDSYYFTPFSGTDDGSSSIMYMLVKVTNNGPTRNVSLFSQQNLHLGTDYATKDEETSYNSSNNYIKEFNAQTGSFAIYKNLNSQNQLYQTGNQNQTPVNYLQSNSNLNNSIQSKGDDLVNGFENKNIQISAGQSQWFGVEIGLREDGNENQLSQTVDSNAQTSLQGSPAAILQQEENWWQNWHAKERMPKGLNSQETQTYRQSTAVLKMSQVREKSEGYGQVLASLIPGEWSIAWVRDGSYSIKALIDSGHYQEAKEALNFFLNAKTKQNSDGTNYFQKNYIESNNTSAPIYGLNTKLSSNYLLSVCRYFGDGSEDSDYNDNGPNIEFDGWGLVLWVLDDYINQTHDYSFLLNNQQVLTAQQWISRKQQIVDSANQGLTTAKQTTVTAKNTYQTAKAKEKQVKQTTKTTINTAKGWIKRKQGIVKAAKQTLRHAKTAQDKQKAQAWLTAKQAELTKELNKQNQVIAQAQQQLTTAKDQVKTAKSALVNAKAQQQTASNWLKVKQAELTKEKAKQEPIIQENIKSTNWYKITTQDADLLIELANKQNGLIQPDSSIWEEHWTPYSVLKNAPARQQFAFTDITAWSGLQSAADMAQKLGFNDSYQKYSQAAAKLKTSILKNLITTEDGQQIIASSIERKGDSQHENDGSTVEAINQGLVPSNSSLAQGMIASYNKYLRIKTGSTPGFMRDQDGDLYDSREWGFIDLRIAGALAKMGDRSESKTLIDWMTSQAQNNYYLIPELLDYTNQDYAGSVPMGGFGSGSYILALNDYYNK
jgi:GH15 family glucan-1,4-alpha-glucosidase